ncbi:MAG: PilZ domain-containing protein [Candidatus Omnitrophota bacterium]|nr:MAG: PilZ domain-containing protein [Candidatus Omnitrophota bacterium]
MKKRKTRKVKRRVVAFLNRHEMEFLDKLSMDSLFSTGYKLSRIDVIAALVDVAMALGISAKGVKSRGSLVWRILHSIRAPGERRQYHRFKKNLDVAFRKMDSLAEYSSSVTEDIGVGGFRMEVTTLGEPLAINQIIEVTISDPQKEHQAIKAIGRVVWMREKEDPQGLEIGVKLTYVKEEDREKFLNCLSAGVLEEAKHHLPLKEDKKDRRKQVE